MAKIAPVPLNDAAAEAVAFLTAFLRFARWRALGAAVLIALGAVFDGLGLLFLVPLLGVVGAGGGPGTGRLAALAGRFLIGFPPATRLQVLLAVFAGLMLLRGELGRRRDIVTESLQLQFVEDIRLGLLHRLAAAGWPAAAGANQARVLQALSVEIHQVGVASSAALLAAVALAMLVGHALVALALAPAAGALAIAVVLAAALVSRPYLARSRAIGRAIIESHVGMAEAAGAFLGGLKLALAQGSGDRFVVSYAAQAASSVRERVLFQALKSRLTNLTSGAAAIAAAAMLYAGVEVFGLAPSVLITLLVVLSRMGALAVTVQQGVQQIAHSLPAHRAILAMEAEFAACGEPRRGSPIARAPPAVDAALQFRGVTYAHDAAAARKPGISQLDLVIRRGAFLGVVGPSGVGKTTFLDLCAGILRPQDGAAYAFGEALCGEALVRHRQQLAYVAQDPFLFDGSVRANLAWTAPGRSDAEMLEALEAMGSRSLLERLAQGLDTRVGHRGVLLSAGERQRLALAGALLRRPRLLLLDEASNALDVPSEVQILEALAALRPQATLLMVAHRTESLRCCDEILELPGQVLRSAQGAVEGDAQKV